jgi:predicted nucleic acid-binding protein
VRLVADANILISELLRTRGRRLFAHPDLQLFIAERAWSEARHELRRRVALMEAQGRLAVGTGPELLDAALGLVELRVTRVPDPIFAHLEQAGRRRIPRDPDDWPTVALALALDAGIWTSDSDFLGCGLPTWTTDTLLAELGDV